jgi:hypothetical protein
LGTKADVSPGVWLAVAAGPVAWAADLLVSYALVKWSCGAQKIAVLRLVTPAALILIALGAVSGMLALARIPANVPLDQAHPDSRRHFLAVLGLAACGFFAVVVLAMAVPRWIFDACQ